MIIANLFEEVNTFLCFYIETIALNFSQGGPGPIERMFVDEVKENISPL